MTLEDQTGLVRLYRSLARCTPLQLGGGYAAASVAATLLYVFGSSHAIPALQWIAGVVNLVVVSLFFTVVTWYRREEVVNAALLLAVTSALSFTIGFSLGVMVLARGSAIVTLAAAGSVFGLPIRILVLTLVFGVLVSVGRRLRPFFAPATLGDSDSKRAA